MPKPISGRGKKEFLLELTFFPRFDDSTSAGVRAHARAQKAHMMMLRKSFFEAICGIFCGKSRNYINLLSIFLPSHWGCGDILDCGRFFGKHFHALLRAASSPKKVFLSKKNIQKKETSKDLFLTGKWG